MVQLHPDTRENMSHRLRKARAAIFILAGVCLVQFAIIIGQGVSR